MPSSEKPAVAPILPLEKPKRRVGGRMVKKPPTQDAVKYYEDVAKEREQFVSNHPLVRQNPEPASSNSHQTASVKLNLVKARMAREAATLEFNRMELEKLGTDTSQVSSRIVSSLSKIADIELEVKKLGHTVIDPNSAEVQNILKMWVGNLQETVTDLVKDGTMSTQTMDLLLNTFANKMEGWEDRLEED